MTSPTASSTKMVRYKFKIGDELTHKTFSYHKIRIVGFNASGRNYKITEVSTTRKQWIPDVMSLPRETVHLQYNPSSETKIRLLLSKYK